MGSNAAILLKTNQRLFHTADLALLWGITKRNTLYTTIKRYVQRGILHKIHKGLYSSVPRDEINSLQIMSSAIHRYCYLTTESVLVAEGVIHQDIQYTTYASSISKKFTVCGHPCRVRKLKDKYLFNNIGVKAVDGINKACTERAVADLLYFNPDYYFDSPGLINWKNVKQLQKDIYNNV